MSPLPSYIKLFIFRESKIVLGRRLSNVWLLTAMLLVSFLSIAFVNGSLNYLGYKMNDPFIKWVEIKEDTANSASLQDLEKELSDSLNAAYYHYGSYSYDYEFSYTLFGPEDDMRAYLRCRFIDPGNKDLINAIVAGKNKIVGIDGLQVQYLSDSSLGVFITEKALRKLGYVDDRGAVSPPAYLDIYRASRGAEQLGFRTTNGRARAPIPVLGVVRRLPGSVDMLAFTNLCRQIPSRTFSMNNEDYASSLCYFIPEDVDEDKFDDRLTELLAAVTDVEFRVDRQIFCPRDLFSYKNRVLSVDRNGYPDLYLGFRQVVSSEVIPPLVANRVSEQLLAEYQGRGVYRIFEYDCSYEKPIGSSSLSVHFDNLQKLSSFATDVVEKNELEIEMSQINAKENFRALSVMAIVMSVVMVIFTIVSILLFVVNLLQSYFQKVKRNIGTFKAFGISNRELEKVYMVIMLSMVSAAAAVSLAAVSVIQLMMRAVGAVHEGSFGYLSLWSCEILHFPPAITLATIVLVVSAVALTVHLVLNRLLSATPGDLVYDR